MGIAVVIVCISMFVVGYTYLGYPLTIWILSRMFGREHARPSVADSDLPSMTVLIAAHNEESVIAERLENALAMDYPAHLLDVVVASDASTDGTATVVLQFADRGVRLLDYEKRRGKSGVLNAAMAEVRSELVFLSDANTNVEADAARKLASWFADPQVGAVCGRLILRDSSSGRNVDGLYWQYETFLKQCEGRLGGLLGANGAIYAIRRKLYVPIPQNMIVDDFVIPLLAKLKSGCEIVYDYEAVGAEETAQDVQAEFRRRARIGAGGFQAVSLLWPLFNPNWGWVSFTLFSHKLLRWVCPFFLTMMFLAATVGAPSSALCRAMFVAQSAFYVVSIGAALLPEPIQRLKFLRLISMFTSMNVALAMGFFRWLGGVRTGAWDRTARVGATLAALPDRVVTLTQAIGGRLIGRRDLIIATALTALSMLIMFDAWKDILRLGMLKEEMSYVLLAPVMIAWIVAARKDLLKTCPVRREWIGLVILVCGWAIFWYGYVADPVLWRAGAVVIAVGAVASALGLDAMLRMWPAALATIFLVPISPTGRYQIAIPLQEATASATQSLCDLMGIYVSRSGNLLSINGVGVTVAEACNGMRMVLTLLMVCYVVAFTSPLRNWVRVLLIVASPVIAIIANVTRLVPTVWMFGNSSKEWAETFHSSAGWVMTFIAFILLMGMVRFLQWSTAADLLDSDLDERPAATRRRETDLLEEQPQVALER